MGVILGELFTLPDPPSVWSGLAMKWFGTDGSEWTLSDSTDGTVMMPGVRGMSMPPIVHHRAAHASVPGARWRGLHVDVREVFWPLQIFTGTGSQDWVEKDRAFWKSLDPAGTGTWTVTLPDGRTRSLTLRYTGDSEYAFSHDAVQDGWSTYGITLEAEQPFWEGEPVTRAWQQGVEVPFFQDSTGDGTFRISPGRTLTTAQLLNPGDVEAYVVWEIHGPVDSAVVGINGKTITIPFAVPDGQVLRIDTNPTAQIALMGPEGGNLTNDKTSALTNIVFAPLPPSAAMSNLSLSVEGSGSISATFTPRYYRAW